jgi:hypothetical protein
MLTAGSRQIQLLISGPVPPGTILLVLGSYFLLSADPTPEDVEKAPALPFGPGPELDRGPEGKGHPAESCKILFVCLGNSCREKGFPGAFRLDQQEMFVRLPGDQVRQVRLGTLDHVVPAGPEQVTGHVLDFTSPGTAGRWHGVHRVSVRRCCVRRAVGWRAPALRGAFRFPRHGLTP